MPHGNTGSAGSIHATAVCYSRRVPARSRALSFVAAITAGCGAGPATPAAVHEAIVDRLAAEPAVVTVHVEAAGFAAEEIEREIAMPIERALAGLDGVGRVRSVSQADAATVTLTLKPDATADAVRAAVHAQLGALARTLPSDVTPVIMADVAARAQARRFVVTGDLDGLTMRATARRIAADLARVPGVAHVELCGGQEPAVTITIDPVRLAARGLTVDAVADGVWALNEGIVPGLRWRVAGPGIEEFARVRIAPGVVVGDVATVALDGMRPDCDAAEVGGGPSLLGAVLPRRGAAGDEFDAALRDRLAAAQASLPVGVRVELRALTRVVLVGTAAAEPASTVTLAGRQLAAALADVRRAGPVYVQAPVPAVVGAPVELELLLPRAGGPELAAALAAVPGLRVRSLGDDERTRGTAIVTGHDLEVAARVAGDLAALARGVPGVLQADVVWTMTPEQEIEPDRARLAEAGLTAAELTRTLAVAVDGLTVGAVQQGDARMPVRVRLGDAPLKDPAALADLQLITPTGSIRVADVATIRIAGQPHAITRIDQLRAIEVELRFAEPTAPREALSRAMAADLRLPPGCTVHFE
jgi:multidrug efflux pump subunit AcrB